MSAALQAREGNYLNALRTARLRSTRWLLRRTHATRLRALPPHLQVGERGELEAFFFLQSLGLTVVARRWTSGKHRGDLDLIAWEGDTLCFVEVKTRSRRDLLDPAEAAVDNSKRRNLRRLARAYIHNFPEQPRRHLVARFDVVSVYLDSTAPACELLRNAFAAHE